MPNERLRAALLERGITPMQLAEIVRVDPKSVQRWVTGGRLPYRRHRYTIAAHLGMDEAYLWPDALSKDEVASASESEIVNVYPHRWAVPSDYWRHFFGGAEHELGVLVYAGMFLSEDSGLHQIFRRKAEAGVAIRFLVGDPDSEAVAQRGTDEGINEAVPAKVRNAIINLRPLRALPGIEFRKHRTVLYNSIYRADDQMLVNTHIYNYPAAQAPVLHLRRVAGGDMFNTYLDSFEAVWDGAVPLE
jgi:transcriptional regulator with XRE-family HTH domain